MKFILIYSGGLDSTVLLYQLLKNGNEVKCLSVNYGQKHGKELLAARSIAEELGVDYEEADLSAVTHLLAGSSLTSSTLEVPEGHYEEESMKATVVPNRNMILLSLAAGWAIANKFDAVAYAAHSGDHAIYPDCREEFTDAVDRAIQLADWHSVRLERPFVGLSKADIVKLGDSLGVPFEQTWSCYVGGDVHCGRCGTCIERREAFYLAGVSDPTIYGPSAPSVDEMLKSGWRLAK